MIPQTLIISGVPYKVQGRTTHELRQNDGTWTHGKVTESDEVIEYDFTNSDRFQVTVIMHEALHAIICHSGMTIQNEEDVVRGLGYQLVQFMLKNPEFVKAVMECEAPDQGHAEDGSKT